MHKCCVGSWETWPQAPAVLKNVAQRRPRRLLRNLQQRGKYKCCPCHLTCFPFWFSYLAKSWYPVVEEWKTSKFFPVKGRAFQGGSQWTAGEAGQAHGASRCCWAEGFEFRGTTWKTFIIWDLQFRLFVCFCEREFFPLIVVIVCFFWLIYLCFKNITATRRGHFIAKSFPLMFWDISVWQ